MLSPARSRYGGATLTMKKTHSTFCRICEALCGLEVDVDANKVVAIRPNPKHVATRGFACKKGLEQHVMFDSPDRVRAPLARRGDTFVPISWEQALSEIGAKVKKIHGERGANAIAMYVGTAAGFSVLHPVFAQGFMTGLGSKSMYATATQDCANKFAVARQMYGFPFTQPFPDVRRTKCLIIVGANPVVSKWSFLQVPNPTQHLRDIERHGGSVFVVDPRKTETAKAAGEHVFIRPDTDPFFYLGFLHELIAQGGVDRRRLDQHATGFDAIETLVREWTPERCAEVTKIDPAVLRRMVAAFRQAEGAALYGSTGINMGSNGSLSFWLQEVINAASGNLDRAGGTLVGHGVIDFAKFGVRTGTLMRDDRSRVGDFASTNDAFPGGILADEILTPGEGQVRALFVTGGNPLITMPNAGRLRRAFESLELLVTVDLFRTETGELAHYVLPATSAFERADLPFIFPLMLGLQARPYLQATEAVVEPEGEVRDEATIYLDLCRASGINLFGSAVAQRAFEALAWNHSRKNPQRQRSVPQRAVLDLLLRACGQRGFGALLAKRDGVLREDHAPGSFLGKRVYTTDGLVQLAPLALLAQARAQLGPAFEREKSNAHAIKLITKRFVTTHNSWTHNHEGFVRGEEFERNFLFVHPEDAARLGLEDGALADVSTDVATVRLPVRYLGDLMPGTVALPHGWGHQHAKGLSVASKTKGVNVNLLAADGPDRIERVSGMAHLTGFVVTIVPSSGPQNEQSWSGL
jgi:anaerobic selenocysteine-containing dehydrogenase